MTVACAHPRPALNMPSGSPARLRWQPPTFIPENLTDLRRFMAEQYRAIFNEFMNAQMARAVVPLIDSLIYAQSGQIIQGIADGQTIVLPPSVPGQLDDVRVVIDAVINPVTVVDPDGNATTLATPGVFDFNAANAQPYGTPPTAAALGGGTFVVETADPVNLPAAFEATDSTEIDWSFSSGLVTLAIINGSVALTRLANQAAETFLGNFGAAPGPPTARAGTSVAGAGLAYTAGGTLAVGSSTSIVVGADDVQRAALTGDVTAAQNSNTTAFRSFSARSVLANATNAAGAPTELQGSTAHHFLKVNAAGTALVFEALPLAAFPTIADDTFLANISGGVAVPSAVALTTLAGAGLTGGADAVLAVGAGTRITVNANDVQLATGAADSFLMNATAGVAAADYRAGASVAGAGLTYTTGGTLAVGAGTNVTVNANDVAVTNFPLTGLATQAADTFNGNFTAGVATPTARAGTSVAGAGLTYTTGGTLAVGAGTHVTVNADDVTLNLTTLVAAIDSTSIIANGTTLERAALTGAVAAGQNGNGTVFSGIRDNGTLETPGRGFLNFLSGNGVNVAITADAGNDELEIAFSVDAADIDSASVVNNAGVLERAALTGDVTASQNSNATTIANDAVTNAKLANMADATVKVNNSGSTGDPVDMSVPANTVVGRNAAGSIVASQVQSGQIASNMRATQAAMEAFSDTDVWVTPGRQQFHPSACKAWIIVDGDGVGVANHHNASTVTDVGQGEITINFDTDFSSAEHAHVAMAGSADYSPANPATANIVNGTARAAGSVTLQCVSFFSGVTNTDPDFYCCSVFGDQ